MLRFRPSAPKAACFKICSWPKEIWHGEMRRNIASLAIMMIAMMQTTANAMRDSLLLCALFSSEIAFCAVITLPAASSSLQFDDVNIFGTAAIDEQIIASYFACSIFSTAAIISARHSRKYTGMSSFQNTAMTSVANEISRIKISLQRATIA